VDGSYKSSLEITFGEHYSLYTLFSFLVVDPNRFVRSFYRVILNVNQTASHWALIPTGEINSLLGGPVARRTGNSVSIEFDREASSSIFLCSFIELELTFLLVVFRSFEIFLYRWHACVGEKDTVWIEQLMRKYSQTPRDQVSSFSFCSLFPRRILEADLESLARSTLDDSGRFHEDLSRSRSRQAYRSQEVDAEV